MSVIDIAALRALVAEEVRRELANHPRLGDHVAAAGPPGHLWTADDVAAFLKASRSWVYMQSEAGRLPCLKVIGLLRFDPAAVRAFAQGLRDEGAKVLPIRRKGP